MRTAIQGEIGSFSHEAALSFGVEENTLVPFARSAELFRALVAAEVDQAVLPIENSLAGSVLEHYDLLRQHPVHILEERLLRIRHNLIVVPGVELAAVTAVYSHPIALDQCRQFFATHTHLCAYSAYDTAGSVRYVMGLQPEERGQAAAIASREAARVYGGQILAAGIEDNDENHTRFLRLRRGGCVMGDALARLGGRRGKVSLSFAVPNRAGSLVEVLLRFADRGINLTKLESRPVPGSPWQYVFYADFEFGGEGEALSPVEDALAAVGETCPESKVLGCYAIAEPAQNGADRLPDARK